MKFNQLTGLIFLIFITLSYTGKAQLNQKEEVLRHIEKSAKLYSHIYKRVDTVKWGYFFGHSRFWDYEWAEKYQIKGKAYVVGVIAHIKGSNATDKKKAFFSIYNVHKDQKPDIQKYTKTVTYKDINVDGSATTILYDSAIAVADSFFVSFGLMDYVHSPEVWGNDTMHLLAAEEGARDEKDLQVFGRNCIRTHGPIPELAWVDAYTGGWNSINTYLAIYPIMDFSYGMEDNYLDQGNFRLFKCFYNKETQVISTSVSSKNSENITLELIDLQGKIVASEQQQLAGNSLTQTLQLNVSGSLQTGTYVLILKGKNISFGQKIRVN